MTKIKSKNKLAIRANILNLCVIALIIFTCFLIKLPAKTYFHAYIALLLYPCVSILSLFAAGVCLVLVTVSFKTGCSRILACLTFAVGIFLAWFSLSFFFPWARYAIHDPAPQSVYWRERAISSVGDGLYFFIRDRQGLIPSNDNWKETLVESGYDFENSIKTWEDNYNSSIVLNENIKGMELDKLDPETVLLFEGPKGTAFGNEETFKQFSQENKYCYVGLINFRAGRVCFKTNQAQSIFSALQSEDLPLTWKPEEETKSE